MTKHCHFSEFVVVLFFGFPFSTHSSFLSSSQSSILGVDVPLVSISGSLVSLESSVTSSDVTNTRLDMAVVDAVEGTTTSAAKNWFFPNLRLSAEKVELA